MLSILIADDEKLARADILYKVSRSGFNFKWVMEASSAEEALEMIREYKPDILLTDICMGEMSGIDLVRAARRDSYNIASVLISGYPEFSFAKEAIALNVVDYILKPVKQEELNTALTTAISKVMNQKEVMQFQVNKEKNVGELLSIPQKEQLQAFLNGMETKLDFSASALFPEKTNFYQIGLIRISFKNNSINKNISKQEYEKTRQIIQDIILDIGGQWLLPFNNYAQKRLITVIAASPDADLCCAEDTLVKKFNEIFQQVNNRLDVVLHIGVSGTAETVDSLLMTQARQTLDLRLFFDSECSGRVFFWERWKKLAVINFSEEDLKLYQKLLAAGDLNKVLATIRRIFSSEATCIALHIRMLYIEVICILARTCIKKVGGSVVSMLGPESLGGSVIDQFSDKEELIDYLCRTISTALNEWMSVTSDVRTVLQNIKNYIESNFTNAELCTQYLSNQFCISLGYLSTSYKKEFNVTISKNIISLRIEYAKKLLTKTKLSIQDISENSGFNNLSYFMRTFKKYANCTPSEFREQIYI